LKTINNSKQWFLWSLLLLTLLAVSFSSPGTASQELTGQADRSFETAQRNAPEELGEYVAGELLIKFADSTKAAAVGDVQLALTAKPIKTFARIGVRHWRLGSQLNVEQALALLESTLQGSYRIRRTKLRYYTRLPAQ